jgi:hypothetical protein
MRLAKLYLFKAPTTIVGAFLFNKKARRNTILCFASLAMIEPHIKIRVCLGCAVQCNYWNLTFFI